MPQFIPLEAAIADADLFEGSDAAACPDSPSTESGEPLWWVNTSPVGRRFLDVAGRVDARVLEIGCEGVAVALISGAIDNAAGVEAHYVLSDASRVRMLATVRQIADQEPLAAAEVTDGTLRLFHAGFPFTDEACNLLLEGEEGGRFDALLVASDSVVCSLSREQVLTAFHQFHRLLKPGGVLCLRCPSPHQEYLRPETRAEMETAVRAFHASPEQQASPHLHLPGYIPRLRDVLVDGSSRGETETWEQSQKGAKGFKADVEGHWFLPSKEVLRWLCVEWLHVVGKGLVVEYCDYEPDERGKVVSLVAARG